MKSTLKIGLVGLGTVGASVFKILGKDADMLAKRAGVDLVVTAVSARNKNKDRGIDLKDVEWFDNPVDLANSDNVDVVVELVGGSEGIAFDVVSTAINQGKKVVTANKALVAIRAKELSALLQENDDAVLYYEACVAAGIPAVKTLREGLAANNIKSISGILNGTCNYIVTEMEETGRNFDDVLKEAQEKGYAEADPSFDIDGIDAGHKLAILSGLAFGVLPDFDAIKMNGIRNVTTAAIKAAAEKGCKLKLICSVTKTDSGDIEQVVKVRELLSDNPLSKVDGVLNAVYFETDYAGDILLTGAGAGGDATASAVIADVIDIARGGGLPLFG